MAPTPSPARFSDRGSSRPQATAHRDAHSRRPTPEPEATPEPLVEGAMVEMCPDVTPPKRISGDSASYPEQARRLKLYGAVGVSLVVDAQGQPTDLKVVESAGQILDEAVLKAVSTWRFQPATKDGVKVSVRWLVRQRFQKGP